MRVDEGEVMPEEVMEEEEEVEVVVEVEEVREVVMEEEGTSVEAMVEITVNEDEHDNFQYYHVCYDCYKHYDNNIFLLMMVDFI